MIAIERCSIHDIAEILAYHGNTPDMDQYRHSERILFLSDGTIDDDNYRKIQLAEQVARKFPRKEITKGDLKILGESKDDYLTNLRRLHLDNTRPMPFDDNRFDTIVLRAGLCHCKGCVNCAGIPARIEDMERFLLEISRILDKTAPGAQAVLHGEARMTMEYQRLWQAAAQRVMNHRGDVTIYILTYDGAFWGIRIIPKKVIQQ